jgi:uncharacterized membrane protein
MKSISRKTSHSLFLAGIIAKAVISLGEIASGLIFTFFSYEKLYNIVFLFFGGELAENPRDFVWEHIFRAFQSFSSTPRAVWAFIFLSHGIVKIILLSGLWRNKRWSYPASIAVFSFFIVYQLYQSLLTPSILLWFITFLDAAVLFLVGNEYRHRKDIVWEV